jgi:hypothetical protein
MAYYYFTAASLPPLVLGERPELSFEQLQERLQINLSKEDFAKVRTLRRLVDLENIRQLYLELSLDPRGNLSEKELDEALLIKDLLPQYVFDFLDQFEEKQEKLRFFFGLIATYYREEVAALEEGFLKRYLSFERELRLVLLGLRSKKVKADLAFQLQFEELSDPIVASILAQKDAEGFDPPQEFADLKEQLQHAGQDPWQQFQVVARYRFNRIEELAGYLLFSIDWILGYVARLMIAEKWADLDEEKGKAILKEYKTG